MKASDCLNDALWTRHGRGTRTPSHYGAMEASLDHWSIPRCTMENLGAPGGHFLGTKISNFVDVLGFGPVLLNLEVSQIQNLTNLINRRLFCSFTISREHAGSVCLIFYSAPAAT